MKAKILGLTTALTFATILFAQRPSSAPDPAILAKLGEIVTVRERLAKNYESLVDAGRAPADSAADIDLAEARIAHALETGQRDAILAAHKELVAAHERRFKRLSSLSRDRFPESDADRAQANLLEAQVRLLRAQK